MQSGKALVLAFFAALLALGVAVHRDYGLSHDEVAQRTTGMVTINYLIDLFTGRGASSELHTYDDRDYAVAFEAPAAALELLLGLTDTRDIFMFRHLLTFLVCLAGAWALYSLALRRFADRRLALLAVAFLVLTPRLFAESFYNSKDAVFVAAYAIALNTAVAFILRPGWRSALLHALASAFAIDIRMAAITIPVATLAILPLRAVKRELPTRTLWTLAIYATATAVFVIALWPWLWSDPLDRFAQALDIVSRFRFDHEILYRGELVRTTQLPWHYVPVWIAITTPPLYLVLFLAGGAATIWRFIKAGNAIWRTEADLQDQMFLAFALLPLVAAMLYNPVLYDGWRQLYFIYPAFLMVALAGWHALWTLARARAWRAALGAVTALSFVVTAVWMWRAHPLQNVYFNPLAGKDMLARYEVDYWGLSLRPALEHLLAHDSSAEIKVLDANYMELAMRFMILRPEQRRRLVETLDGAGPHYAFTNFPPNRHREKNVAYGPDYELFHEVKVAGEVVLRVFKSRTSRSPRG
jgi:hypothetical protein